MPATQNNIEPVTCKFVTDVPGGPEVVEEGLLQDHLSAEPRPELWLGREGQLGVKKPGDRGSELIR